MLKSAIVGCGSIAGVHAEVLHEMNNVELAAFADNKPERARAFADHYGGSCWGSLDQLLEQVRPDVVHVCTPHYLHVPMALAAQSMGAHVFLEKPPVISRQELAILEASFRDSPQKPGICFQNRYNGAVRYLREILAEERYGKVLGARALSPGPGTRLIIRRAAGAGAGPLKAVASLSINPSTLWICWCICWESRRLWRPVARTII